MKLFSYVLKPSISLFCICIRSIVVVKILGCYRYNKPLQASVRAVTSGTLWALKREDFRGILMSEFSNLSSLKMLRSVDLLSRLTILQLSHIAESLSEVSFSDGQSIVKKVSGFRKQFIFFILKKIKIVSQIPPSSLYHESAERSRRCIIHYPEGASEN